MLYSQWNYRRLSVCHTEANRTELRVRHGEPHSNFLIIFVFIFVKSSVRWNRTSKWTEYDAFNWWRYWIMFSWSIRNTKIRKSSGMVRCDKIEFDSIRFKISFKFDSYFLNVSCVFFSYLSLVFLLENIFLT